MIAKACESCGKTTEYRPSKVRRFCSHRCANQATGPARRKRMALSCERCAETFSVTEAAFRARSKSGYPPRYCSTACAAAASICNRATVCCAHCGKAFSKRKDHVSERNFCSRACLAAGRINGGPWSKKPDVEARRAYFRAYVAKDREKHNAKAAERARNNRPYRNYLQQMRRAAGELTYAQWLELTAGGVCAHCGSTERIQVDHIIPIIRGGKTESGNLQLLCAPCNQSKGAGEKPKRHLMKSVHNIDVRLS